MGAPPKNGVTKISRACSRGDAKHSECYAVNCACIYHKYGA